MQLKRTSLQVGKLGNRQQDTNGKSHLTLTAGKYHSTWKIRKRIVHLKEETPIPTQVSQPGRPTSSKQVADNAINNGTKDRLNVSRFGNRKQYTLHHLTLITLKLLTTYPRMSRWLS